MTDFRIGHGYDVHRLVAGRKLILGGIEIANGGVGLLGHSDADVLVHALMDAMLGAVALGDIGRHFPDSDEEYKDISSLVLLEKAAGLCNSRGYTLSNADITVIAQKPKLAPYIDAMLGRLSNALKVPSNALNIKATTEEGLGFTGGLEGISAHAVVIMEKISSR